MSTTPVNATPTATTYFHGLPTAPDVERLLLGIAVQPGTMTPHEAVEEVLGISRRLRRYTSVTKRWRRTLLAEKNIDICAVAGRGFRALTAGERLDISIRDFQSAGRGITRAYTRFSRIQVQDIPEMLLPVHDHARRLMTTGLDTIATTTKALAGLMPTPVLPRRGDLAREG